MVWDLFTPGCPEYILPVTQLISFTDASLYAPVTQSISVFFESTYTLPQRSPLPSGVATVVRNKSSHHNSSRALCDAQLSTSVYPYKQTRKHLSITLPQRKGTDVDTNEKHTHTPHGNTINPKENHKPNGKS